MASFASYRRSGWVRLLVLILCAFFIFCTLGAPPAQALGVESVAVFGLASVLSAATAALGFKLSSNEQGQATLQKMVQDFKTVAWATGFVLVGSKLNGLQNGMDYIKMAVHNGKTYLDERIFAWCQKWLAENGVYDSGLTFPEYNTGDAVDFQSFDLNDVVRVFSVYSDTYKFDPSIFGLILQHENLDISDGYLYNFKVRLQSNGKVYYYVSRSQYDSDYLSPFTAYATADSNFIENSRYTPYGIPSLQYVFSEGSFFGASAANLGYLYYKPDVSSSKEWISYCPCFGTVVSNDTGLSGTDTLGKDVVDLTLDQILEKLKEWAQDWYDAGADSATNAATGAKDLPLTVATGAATANPSIAEDGPLVWFPPFSIPIPNLRTGETDTKTVDQGKENVSAVETSTDVAENQSVIDSLVNWALSYISPDTGLFSKFPLCVPYDAYLLVTSSLGVDAVGSDSIFGASPGDLDGVVSQDIETYSDFQPIINIKHDFELDGKTYPVELTIDLTPWQPLVTFFREGMALLLVAELIGSEFKRIRGH